MAFSDAIAQNVQMRKIQLVALIAAVSLAACSTYDPLKDESLRKPIGRPVDKRAAVKVTFLGNTTLAIEDKDTTLLIDGFLSRPGPFQTLFGGMRPSAEVIQAELAKAGIHRVNAVLVGHAHHDHALDATAIADLFGAKVAGSHSYANIYRGSHIAGSKSRLVVIPRTGGRRRFGAFSVSFSPSEHVAPDSWIQRIIAGEIEEPLKMPAHSTRFKCGDVFAFHISHPQGDIVVTTTAGATPGQLQGRNADVLFLGVGYLSEDRPHPERQDFYWRHTVTATQPDVIVPVHWDDFSNKLSNGLKPAKGVAGNTQSSMSLVKRKAGTRKVRVLDLRESVWISQGRVYIP